MISTFKRGKTGFIHPANGSESGHFDSGVQIKRQLF